MAKRKKQKNIFKQILRQATGLGIMMFVVFCWGSCVFYNPTDSSFLISNSLPVKNFFGPTGANFATFILHWFGFSLIIFLIAPLFWGYSNLKKEELICPYSRFFAFILGVLTLSISLNSIPTEFNLFKLGGLAGYKISEFVFSLANNLYPSNLTKYILITVFSLLSFLSFNFSVGINYKFWLKICNYIYRFLFLIFKIIMIIGFFAWSIIFKRQTPTRIERKTPKKKVNKKEEKTLKTPVQPIEKTRVVSVVDSYVKPSFELLTKSKDKNSVTSLSQKDLEKTSFELESVLKEFGVEGKIVKANPGPVVTLYELEPAPGIKIARVIVLAPEIARSMGVQSVRVAVIPGSKTIGIEIPNSSRNTVWLRELFEDDNFINSQNNLNVVLGKDIGGKNIYADLSGMPHLLVAGTTGSGKSVGVNSMILSILFNKTPDECKFIMIDPKMLEFSVYNGIPHLLTPVITDPSKAVIGLKWAVKEMEDRYRAMTKLNVKNITGYNKKVEEIKASGKTYKRTIQTGFDKETGAPIYEEQEMDLSPLPYIVVVVDEMADLMLVARKDVEAAIQRLAQMARAAGIHLIMSTQRPSVDVITGTIKANFPARISFQVTSKIDSRTILGEQGAEQLLGKGDMLYMPAGLKPIRIHGAFVKEAEIEKVVEFIKTQKQPEYIEGITEGETSSAGDSSAVFDNTSFGGISSDNDLYKQAVEIVLADKKASTSYIQRRLRIGYNRAASLIDRMEEEGLISKPDHVGRREVY